MFDSNLPTFFTVDERIEFEDYLERLPGPQWVIESNSNSIVASGGWAPSRKGASVANLCWGMVLCGHHRTGLGRLLLRARLADIANHPEIVSIEMNTSQHSCGFFQREGFAIDRVQKDFFAKGLDRYEMSLTCTDAWRRNRRT